MRLALIYSGGTIGCAGSPLKPLPVREFQRLWGHAAAPLLPDALAVDWQWLTPPLDSSDMAPADWGRLAGLALGAQEEQAVLLLHGTDTMAWTAAALAYLLTLYGPDGRPEARFGLPVVVTGAQRPLFEGEGLREGTDALENLRTALAACGTARAEVRVAFGGLDLPGARVMKLSTTADRAFDCPTGEAPCPALPAADRNALRAQLDAVVPHLGRKAVISLTPSPAAARFVAAETAAVIDALGEELGAIYLNGFGIGNYPARDLLAPLLRAAHDRGVLIVAGSQVPGGAVDPATYGAGSWLSGCGALAARDMTTAAAQAKLHLALALGAARGWQQAEMERFLLTPVAGELSG